MAYTLEIGIHKVLGNRPSFRSAQVGDPTSSHWEPVLTALGLDAEKVGSPDGDWTLVDNASFRTLDLDHFLFHGRLPKEVVDEIRDLQAFADDDPVAARRPAEAATDSAPRLAAAGTLSRSPDSLLAEGRIPRGALRFLSSAASA